MKYQEIIKLLDAGYSRDEILKMQDEKEDPKPEEKKEDPKPEEKKEDPKPEEKEDPIADTLKGIKDMFADMKKEFTAMNILNSQREDVEKTADDYIANIINPFDRKEK